MKRQGNVYFPFLGKERLGIFAEVYDKDDILFMDGNSVPLHAHEYVEIMFIKEGIFQHHFKNTTAFLTTGDIIFIPPHQYHGSTFNHKITFYNFQIYPDKSRKYLLGLINELTQIQYQQIIETKDTMDDFKLHSADFYLKNETANSIALKNQGILHLSPGESYNIESYFQQIINEQSMSSFGANILCKNFAEAILIAMIRSKEKINDLSSTQVCFRKKNMITAVLAYIEDNYSKEVDFDEMAKLQHLTANYFRAIFKEVTGVTPTKYLNRFRILKALELLQKTNLSIIDVAFSVGFYDANYFARVFKNFIGYPPKYFKRISMDK